MDNYLEGIKKQFLYYKKLSEQAIAQLSDEDLFWQYNEESNSIATIIHHLSGNMLSRFTDFLTSDGEKPWRNRDAEFEIKIQRREELIKLWDKGWACLIAAINQLNHKDLHTIIYIRNDGHTITEALNRQLAHYPYHVGQIVFIAKMRKNEEWKTLSIARNKSTDYNTRKFSNEKEKRHFTDDL